MSAPRYTGTLRYDRETSTIVGVLYDSFQWPTHFTGTRQADGTYLLDGVAGEPPESLRIPVLDDPQVAPARRVREPAVRAWVEVEPPE